MLFGALISATDPVAVVALFKDLKAPERLSVLVEGESLFNDATTIVLFTVLLTLMNSDARGPMILVQGTASFVSVAPGGLGVGALMALLYAALVRVAEDDPLVDPILPRRAARLAVPDRHLLRWGAPRRSALGPSAEPSRHFRTAATHSQPDRCRRAVHSAGSRYDGRSSDSVPPLAVTPSRAGPSRRPCPRGAGTGSRSLTPRAPTDPPPSRPTRRDGSRGRPPPLRPRSRRTSVGRGA